MIRNIYVDYRLSTTISIMTNILIDFLDHKMPTRAAKLKKSSSGNIKNFFKQEAKEESQETKEEISPGKTSDYESEPSRSNTPSTNDTSRSNSPTSTNMSTETSSVVKAEVKEENVEVKREVITSEDDDENGVDIFNSAEEDLDDKEDVKAAIMSGLLTEDVKREEERMKEETERMERQEEAKRKQELAKEAEMLSTQQRYERLQLLLNKSKFYSDFLLKKMKSHEDAMKLKLKVQDERVKKRVGQGNDEEETSKGRKRGRKKNDGPASKKAKLEADATPTTGKDEVAKIRNDHQRTFEGRDIPPNQPMLLTGGIMRSYQLEGYEWMATLWENGINGKYLLHCIRKLLF